MRERTSPENGHVLVRRETRDGIVVYILRTAPGTDHYLLREPVRVTRKGPFQAGCGQPACNERLS